MGGLYPGVSTCAVTIAYSYGMVLDPSAPYFAPGVLHRWRPFEQQPSLAVVSLEEGEEAGWRRAEAQRRLTSGAASLAAVPAVPALHSPVVPEPANGRLALLCLQSIGPNRDAACGQSASRGGR